MDAKLIIACHKPCDVPEDPLYVPMHVGSAGKDIIPGFTRDDSGDNISAKNPVYCELTGLYWAWKNLDCDYLGLVHYRRYFTAQKQGRIARLLARKSSDPGTESGAQEDGDTAATEKTLSQKDLQMLLGRYRILLPKKRHYYIESIYSHYSHTFDGAQLDKTREILEKDCPEYLAAFDRVMHARSAYIFNMYVMPKGLSDAYCTWLFSVLEKLEVQIDTTGMTDFERRYAGRISERLLNVWLLRQIETGAIRQNEIGEVPYFYLGEIDWRRKVTGFLGAKFLKKKYEESF